MKFGDDLGMCGREGGLFRDQGYPLQLLSVDLGIAFTMFNQLTKLSRIFSFSLNHDLKSVIFCPTCLIGSQCLEY